MDVEFLRWFSDSKIVDARGKPLVVYHGTRAFFDQFRSKNRNSSIGFHFGDISQAENFAGFNAHGLTAFGGNVVPAYLRITRPIHVPDVFGGKRKNVETLARHLYMKGLVNAITYSRTMYAKTIGSGWRVVIKALKENGNDGIVYRNNYEGDIKGDNLAYIVFDSEQIRSVFDRAIYTPTASGGAETATCFP